MKVCAQQAMGDNSHFNLKPHLQLKRLTQTSFVPAIKIDIGEQTAPFPPVLFCVPCENVILQICVPRIRTPAIQRSQQFQKPAGAPPPLTLVLILSSSLFFHAIFRRRSSQATLHPNLAGFSCSFFFVRTTDHDDPPGDSFSWNGSS